MDGMGELDNAPQPPMGAEQGMPMGDPNAMGGEPEPMPDEMEGVQGQEMPTEDPNAMGDDISAKYQQLSPDQQKAADKYVDSMLNNESVDVIKKAIDETFSTILDDTKEGTKRPQKELEKGLKRHLRNPYVPYE